LTGWGLDVEAVEGWRAEQERRMAIHWAVSRRRRCRPGGEEDVVFEVDDAGSFVGAFEVAADLEEVVGVVAGVGGVGEPWKAWMYFLTSRKNSWTPERQTFLAVVERRKR